MKRFTLHFVYVLLVIVCTVPRSSCHGKGDDSMPYTFTDVQLVEGQPPYSGRVQVQINNSTWLDVCYRPPNMWDDNDGRVVCRQLGFQGQPVVSTNKLQFTPNANGAVKGFQCAGTESSLSECAHSVSDNCKHGNLYDGAGVTCTPFPTTEPPTEAPTTKTATTEATTQEPEQPTTPGIAVTTQPDEMGGTTVNEAITPVPTTGGSDITSAVSMGTRPAGVTNPEPTRSPNEGDGTTSGSTAGDGGFGAQDSNPGAYIGLALGLVLFIVCAGVIVVCLLKRRKRQDKTTSTASLKPLTDVQQHGAVHDNSLVSNHIKMGELGSSTARQAAPKPTEDSPEYTYCAVEARDESEMEPGYVAPNPSPAKSPLKDPASSNQKASLGLAGIIANPYYQDLDARKAPEDKALKPKAQSESSYYSKVQPDSPTAAATDEVQGNTDYFTLEDGGDLVDNGQYTTGVVGEQAASKPAVKPKQTPDSPQGADDEDHYYAKREASQPENRPGDYDYAYADAPREGANTSAPNADYFLIEEAGNAMGAPVYNAGGKGSRQPAMESEYAYADPGPRRAEDSAEETEGWVENIVYVAGP